MSATGQHSTPTALHGLCVLQRFQARDRQGSPDRTLTGKACTWVLKTQLKRSNKDHFTAILIFNLKMLLELLFFPLKKKGTWEGGLMRKRRSKKGWRKGGSTDGPPPRRLETRTRTSGFTDPGGNGREGTAAPDTAFSLSLQMPLWMTFKCRTSHLINRETQCFKDSWGKLWASVGVWYDQQHETSLKHSPKPQNSSSRKTDVPAKAAWLQSYCFQAWKHSLGSSARGFTIVSGLGDFRAQEYLKLIRHIHTRHCPQQLPQRLKLLRFHKTSSSKFLRY